MYICSFVCLCFCLRGCLAGPAWQGLGGATKLQRIRAPPGTLRYSSLSHTHPYVSNRLRNEITFLRPPDALRSSSLTHTSRCFPTDNAGISQCLSTSDTQKLHTLHCSTHHSNYRLYLAQMLDSRSFSQNACLQQHLKCIRDRTIIDMWDRIDHSQTRGTEIRYRRMI